MVYSRTSRAWVLFFRVIFKFIELNYAEFLLFLDSLRLKIVPLGAFVISCWGMHFRGLIVLNGYLRYRFVLSELFPFGLSSVLSLKILWFDFGEHCLIFSMRGLVISLVMTYHHTVTLSCMHAGFSFSWQGDNCLWSPSVSVTRWVLSFVISSSVPSVHSISMARGHLRESESLFG